MFKPFFSIAPLLRFPALLTAAGILVGSGCSKDPGDGAPASAAAATTKGKRPDAAPTGEKGGPEGPGGRRAASIILAASDVMTVERASIEAGVAVSGDLKAIEEAVVRARLEGDLVGVYAREGDHVKEGQLLAHFEDSEQESNRTSAIADREAAQSDLETAKWNADQSEQLFKAGAIAERDLRTAQQTYAATRARLAAAEARVRATTSLLTDTRALAPTTGVVAKRSVENGEHVARGASMFTVVRSDVLELAASVPARQANSVKVGQAVHFNADGHAIEGRVARVSPTIDPSTRSVAVYAQIGNPGGAIKGGTFATGRVVSRVVDGALKVPTGALRQSQDNGAPYVYRIEGRTIDIAQLQLGVIDDRAGFAEVLSGLSDGDRVVVGNVGSLGRGMQVQVLGGESGRQGVGGGTRGGGGNDNGAGRRRNGGSGAPPANAR